MKFRLSFFLAILLFSCSILDDGDILSQVQIANGYGFSAGGMMRLGNKAYLILPEISARKRMSGFFFESPTPALQLEAKAGLLFNFSKRK